MNHTLNYVLNDICRCITMQSNIDNKMLCLYKNLSKRVSATEFAAVGMIFSTYVIFKEIRYNKEETDRKMKRLEEEIKELKRGE